MKIRNDFVRLKLGEKQYEFNNLVLDEYLKLFASTQLTNDISNIRKNKMLYYCYIKLDTPLEDVTPSSKITVDDFDFFLVGNTIQDQIINENQITVNYIYGNSSLAARGEKNLLEEKKWADYNGRKITEIGFTRWFSVGFPIYAVLDVSNYDIYIQDSQLIQITRRDIITTDSSFYSNNKEKIPGPIHLAPLLSGQSTNSKWSGALYSVGLSSYTNYIDKEFVIGEDIDVVNNGTEIEIDGIDNYLSTDIPIYCNSDLYPSNGLFPVKTNYKYIILKYKVWQENYVTDSEGNDVNNPIDTGYYYHQAIPIDKFGKTNIKIKYERG